MGFDFIREFETLELEDGKLWSPNDLPSVLACNSDAVFVTGDGVTFNPEQQMTLTGFSGAIGTYYLGSTYYVIKCEGLAISSCGGVEVNANMQTSMSFSCIERPPPNNCDGPHFYDIILAMSQ